MHGQRSVAATLRSKDLRVRYSARRSVFERECQFGRHLVESARPVPQLLLDGG